jgi:hypothetical protein
VEETPLYLQEMTAKLLKPKQLDPFRGSSIA